MPIGSAAGLDAAQACQLPIARLSQKIAPCEYRLDSSEIRR
jgi:hypothetical protein